MQMLATLTLGLFVFAGQAATDPPLTEDGLKLISSEDKHPMRWVHALDRVMVITLGQSQTPPASAPAPSPSH